MSDDMALGAVEGLLISLLLMQLICILGEKFQVDVSEKAFWSGTFVFLAIGTAIGAAS